MSTACATRRLLLGQRDRGVGRDPLSLPVIASGAIETDTECDRLGFVGLDDTEVKRRWQAGDGHRVGDAIDANHQLADFRSAQIAEVVCRRRDGLTELGVRRDGPGVGDVEDLGLLLPRCQVGVVQVERAGRATVVGQAEVQRGRLDVDVTFLAGGECRTRTTREEKSDDGHASNGDTDTLCLVRAEDVLDTGGHDCPLSCDSIVTIEGVKLYYSPKKIWDVSYDLHKSHR